MHLLLKWSFTALLAANGADAVTSWQRPELNPLLGPQFGVHSAAIKFGAIGGIIAAESLLLRRRPELQRTLAVGNFALAGALGSAAIHNQVTQ